VSKFFKALENAERERDTDRELTAAAPPPPPSAVAVDAAAPGVETVPPPAPPAVGFGAPLVRETGASSPHHRAFRGLLAAPPGDEPGQIDDHLVSLLEPTSAAAEHYRAIRLHVETLHREQGLRLVAVSSPARGDGRTLSAINLAGALAQAPEARVVLVEVDMRNPGAADYLGLDNRRGLSTYLLDAAMEVDAVLERPGGVGFSLIVAGPAPSMPYELLKSPRLASLLHALRARFDYVVIDTPPALPYPDTGILRDLVDGFVLVVRANRTPRELVRDAVAALGTRRVLGVVFNDDERMAGPPGAEGWRSRLSRPRGGARAA
jgi:capsular exopolysaccharide synthesis family protein